MLLNFIHGGIYIASGNNIIFFSQIQIEVLTHILIIFYNHNCGFALKIKNIFRHR